MRAHEFTATITPDGKVDIPVSVSELLLPGRPVRLIVLVSDEDEQAWQRLTANQFLAGYNEADAIYDEIAA